jgi:3',5'-cyclic AMP phosphodiesterase CpdA
MSLSVIQISDTHFSRDGSLFRYNWEIIVDMIREAPPDLVVCTGDIAMNGPHDPDDLVYAREQLDRLGVEVLPIPGNHDVGDITVGHDVISETFVGRYRDVFGPDFWVAKRKDWVLIGLNAQLAGSALVGEDEQLVMLADALSAAKHSPVAVFNHKALYLSAPELDDPKGWTVPLAQRDTLRGLLHGHDNVRLYASGHFHRYRELDDGVMKMLWAPSPAFITNHQKFASRGGIAKAGYARIELASDGGVATSFVEDNAMIQFDIQNAINDGGVARRRWMSKLSLSLVRAA